MQYFEKLKATEIYSSGLCLPQFCKHEGSYLWIRCNEVIHQTWSSLKVSLVLITHTYPLTG